MKFLQEVDSFYIEIGLIVVFIAGHIIVQRKNDLKLTLQYWLYSYGIAMLLLSTTIPHVFKGFPYDVSDLENKKRLLYHLQRNNEALVQATESIRSMGFITFLFISIVISKVIKNLKLENPDK
jgi:hypothetical protein